MEAIDSIASCINNGEHVTVVGFRNGETLTVRTNNSGATQLIQRERLGGTAVKAAIASEPGEKPMVLISSDSELALITDFGSSVTNGAGVAGSKHRVWPVDVSNPTPTCPAVDSFTVLPRKLISDRDGTVPLLLISGPRILFTELQLQPGPAHRHIPVDGTPTRIIYSHHLKCLVVAVIRKDRPTLMFLDPDTGEDLGQASDKEGSKFEFARGLGKPGDKIHGLAEWEYRKDNNVWQYLLVSTAYGRMMVISTEKEKLLPDARPPRIRYWVRFQRKGMDRPVYSILGHDDMVIYCVGTTVHWDVLDTTEKKLRRLDSYQLGSPVTSLKIINGKLVALTYKDSLEIIERPTADSNGPVITQLGHSDRGQRNAINMIQIAGTPGFEPLSSLILVCDRDCGVGGLWVPWQSSGKDCEIVFEAELPASIRAFRRGRTRPLWEQRKPQYGRIPMTVDDAEILGVCLDGSLQSFQLLNVEIWRVLRFIVNLALIDWSICPFTHFSQEERKKYDPEPVVRHDLLHIDGDILQRCVEKRVLERLMSQSKYMSRFKELLDDLEDGRLTDEIGSATQQDEDKGYFDLAYRILQHFLAPVL
jgi:hypothetical protein